MTITNGHLDNIAKAMAGEAFDYPTHALVATGVNTSIDITDTGLVGEIGSRLTSTASRALNVVTFTSLRSGTDVIDSANGDDLTAVGFDLASTGDNLQFGVTTSELHTTAFDLEIEAELTYGR